MAERRGLKAEEIYLKVPTSRKGISNICSILRITTSTADEAKDDPRIRTDMIIPAVSRAFLAPMRLTMAGAQNMISALSNSPPVVTKPNTSVPRCGLAKKLLKKLANCWSNTS
ncbi:Uncharacterised protein [Klebsiella pneumoniae]|nr:Uncharacterised protein [Klebsiella pneumoniae]VGF45609.1 Uncharacterised protein [Klebsiella pneumoniae]